MVVCLTSILDFPAVFTPWYTCDAAPGNGDLTSMDVTFLLGLRWLFNKQLDLRLTAYQQVCMKDTYGSTSVATIAFVSRQYVLPNRV
jgi:hypothetical protein